MSCLHIGRAQIEENQAKKLTKDKKKVFDTLKKKKKQIEERNCKQGLDFDLLDPKARTSRSKNITSNLTQENREKVASFFDRIGSKTKMRRLR